MAPVEGQEKIPSVCAARLAMANASASGTLTTSSKSSGRSSGGQDPMPPPSIWCVPGTPPDRTRRLRWLDYHATQRWQSGAKPTCRAEKAACRANVAAERPDSRWAGQLLEQLLAEPPIAVQHVGIVKLIGPERSGLSGDL